MCILRGFLKSGRCGNFSDYSGGNFFEAGGRLMPEGRSVGVITPYERFNYVRAYVDDNKRSNPNQFFVLNTTSFVQPEYSSTGTPRMYVW